MESPAKSSPVKQTSILRYMSPQKSVAQTEAEQHTAQSEAREDPVPRERVPRHLHKRDGFDVTQSEHHISGDVTDDMCTAEGDDVSDNACAVASDKGNAVEADWETSMEADWDDGDVDDADLLNQNETEEEEEPWLCAKRRKL